MLGELWHGPGRDDRRRSPREGRCDQGEGAERWNPPGRQERRQEMKKLRILQVPPVRFGLVLGFINGVIGMIVAPVMLVTLGAAATAADLNYAPKLLGIPWLFAGAASLF